MQQLGLSLPLAGGITSPLFSLLLYWLPLCLRIDFKILLITFEACLSLALSYLYETLTRASIKIVVFKKKKMGEISILVIWFNYPSQASPATCGTFFVQLYLWQLRLFLIHFPAMVTFFLRYKIRIMSVCFKHIEPAAGNLRENATFTRGGKLTLSYSLLFNQTWYRWIFHKFSGSFSKPNCFSLFLKLKVIQFYWSGNP